MYVCIKEISPIKSQVFLDLPFTPLAPQHLLVSIQVSADRIKNLPTALSSKHPSVHLTAQPMVATQYTILTQ